MTAQLPRGIHTALSAAESLQITEHPGKSFQTVRKCSSSAAMVLLLEMSSHIVSPKDLFQGDVRCHCTSMRRTNNMFHVEWFGSC